VEEKSGKQRILTEPDMIHLLVKRFCSNPFDVDRNGLQLRQVGLSSNQLVIGQGYVGCQFWKDMARLTLIGRGNGEEKT
jgi:hypothetical protein